VRDQPAALALAGRLRLPAPRTPVGDRRRIHRTCNFGKPLACASGIPDRRPGRTSGQ
jgi:hypothetical protein